MAVLFTLLQGMEYLGVSYTIADSVFGSTFYMGTGFHGYLHLPLFIFIQLFIYFSSIIPINNKNIKDILDFHLIKSDLVLIDKNNNEFKLNKAFIEWLVG